MFCPRSVSVLIVRHVVTEDGSGGGCLGRNALHLVKLVDHLAAIADAVCRCRQMGCPVEHDLQSDACLPWPVEGVTFFFRRILHCSKEVEGRKGKGEHRSFGCVRRLCGCISDDICRCLYTMIFLKEARMRVPKGSQIGRSPCDMLGEILSTMPQR